MSKNNINNELIITTSARLSNEVGLNNLSLKIIAEEKLKVSTVQRQW